MSIQFLNPGSFDRQAPKDSGSVTRVSHWHGTSGHRTPIMTDSRTHPPHDPAVSPSILKNQNENKAPSTTVTDPSASCGMTTGLPTEPDPITACVAYWSTHTPVPCLESCLTGPAKAPGW